MKSLARSLALFVVLSCILTRMVVAYDPFPGWADDPTRLPWTMSTIGPAESMTIDAVMLLASAALAFVTRVPWDRRIGIVWGLSLCGIASAVGWALARGGDVQTAVIGLNWAAAVGGACALWQAGRDEKCRRVAASVLLGSVGLVALRAGVQYLVENPQAYADFRANKANILEAHGWTAESSHARSFERRVSQPDAGGWFGLSNVLGGFAAGAAVALGVLALVAWRERGKAALATGGSCVLIGLAAALATLVFSMSKGAIIAALVGVAVAAGARVLLKRVPIVAARRMAAGTLLGVACVAGPLLAVVARGMVGERLGELSLWFRWFYMQGAWSMMARAEGLWGVGPSGFQQAYVELKPSISPENVSSAHSVLLDYAATLGVAGVAWCALLIGGAMLAGRRIGALDSGSPGANVAAGDPPGRTELRMIVGIAIVATMIGATVEREIASPWSTGVRLVGMLLFGVIASGVMTMFPTRRLWTSIALAAGALTALMHAQIDMLGTAPGSAAWLLGLLAIAAAPMIEAETVEPAATLRQPFWKRAWVSAIPAFVLLGSVGLLVPTIARVWTWQSHITHAAAVVRPIPMAKLLLSDASLGSPQDRVREVAQVLGQALGRIVPANPAGIDVALRDARMTLADEAIVRMAEACAVCPDHMATSRATSELIFTQGYLKRVGGEVAAGDQLATRAREVAERFLTRNPRDASAWAWLGLLNRSLAEDGKDVGAAGRSIQAYTRAAEIDRHGVTSVLALVEVLVAQGRAEEAQRWAAEGLRRNANLRLDPLAGLTGAQTARLEAVAEGG